MYDKQGVLAIQPAESEHAAQNPEPDPDNTGGGMLNCSHRFYMRTALNRRLTAHALWLPF